jgi:hypothetical protein
MTPGRFGSEERRRAFLPALGLAVPPMRLASADEVIE